MANRTASYDLHIEEPDILVAHYKGYFEGPDVTAVLADERRVIGDKPYVFVLGNIADLQGVTVDGRRAAALGTGELPLAGVVLYGAAFHIRVIVGLFFAAGTRLGRLPMPMSFAANEKEARQWIAARRRDYPLKTKETPSLPT